VLEARVAGRPTMVATSEISDVDAAIAEVRDDLIRQITDAKNRTEPQNNRQLRNS
jgi:ribosome-associated translation inhibitor RaiA